MNRHIRSLIDGVFGPFARKADVENCYAQIAALIEIRDIVGPGVPLGPFRGWAISPDALLTVLRDVVACNSPRVVEFGAGESTIAIAGALRAAGAGSLVTIEHDARYVQTISARLEKLGLLDYVTISLVPMRQYESRLGLAAFSSYDLGELNVDFDVALVDGPVTGQFGEATRSVPLDWCVGRLQGERVVYLDDAGRAAEASVIRASKQRWVGLDVDMIETEKGLLRLRSSAAAAAVSR